MARTNGPTKGTIVINYPPNAESYIFEIEPINIDNASDLANVLDGSQNIRVTITDDNTLSIKYGETSLEV